MMLNRRALLAAGAAAFVARKPASATQWTRYLSAAATLNGRYAVVALSMATAQIDLRPRPRRPRPWPGGAAGQQRGDLLRAPAGKLSLW